MLNYEDYCQAADLLRSRIGGFSPEVLLILGTGIGYLAESIEDPVVVPYREVPHMPVSTASSPCRKPLSSAGWPDGVSWPCRGASHIYEGYTAEQVAFPVRLARLLGCRDMIVTNAAGAVNYNYHVGDIMLISEPDPLV